MTLLRLIILLLVSALITGCGFHSPQQTMLPDALHHLALQTPNQYSPLTTIVANHLKSLGIKITPKKEAPYRLLILSEDRQQVVNNISANTQVRHFTLIEKVTIQLNNSQGCVLLAPTSIQAQTHYAVNTQQILGLNSLLAQAERSLHRDIARQLLFRLGAEDVVKAIHTLRTSKCKVMEQRVNH